MEFSKDITETFGGELGLKHRFCAVDLAPNDQLESGFSAMDRDRVLIRMDKLYRDDEMIAAIENLGPANSLIVVIDMPKSLSLPGRWRQEEIKMHPFRLKTLNRYETRGMRLYDRLRDKGILAFLYFNYWTRMNYDMLIPFRSRSPQGCRALQTMLEYQLAIKNLPTNLAPSSVLESVVGAYAAWSVPVGKPGTDYQVFETDTGQQILIPLEKPHLTLPPPKRSRRYRRERGLHVAVSS